MALTARHIPASPSVVFDVLTDPDTYPEWLIGASHIRDVDDTWPAPGSKFHHVVGVEPFVIPDSTEVLAIEVDRLLKLRVRARPMLVAEATFVLVGNDVECVVTLEEELAGKPFAELLRPVTDPAIHHRNHRSLGRLARVVERRLAHSEAAQPAG